ncbi:MAG: hypothetical protein E4H09_01970 [Spirochaetales bacterium]|nr:MAG: hypothetical protein E4H09_01970 [Spirochaetales bacterium]
MAVAVCILSAILLPGALGAQETSVVAYLHSGPDPGSGVEFLQPNVTPYWQGIYAFGGANIVVWFLDYTVAEAESWERTRCSTRVIRADSGAQYFYYSAGSWSVFVAVAADIPPDSGEARSPAASVQGLPVEPDLICLFVDRFVDRYNYFQRVDGPRRTASRTPPSFPAVLQIR